MRRVAIAAVVLMVSGFALRAEELIREMSPKDVRQAEKDLEGMEPVMIDVTNRAPPSPDEWTAMHAEGERAGLLGSLADFRSKTIAFMNTRYYTANPAEGTLASFGKMDSAKRYDRYGQIGRASCRERV